MDRLVAMGEQFLTCSYHLDKETGTKSGDFNLLKIENQKIVKKWQSEAFEYGILSIKEEKEGFSVGCSDGAIRFVNPLDSTFSTFSSESEG